MASRLGGPLASLVLSLVLAAPVASAEERPRPVDAVTDRALSAWRAGDEQISQKLSVRR